MILGVVKADLFLDFFLSPVPAAQVGSWAATRTALQLAQCNQVLSSCQLIEYLVKFVFLYLLKCSVDGISVLISLGKSKLVLRTCNKN